MAYEDILEHVRSRSSPGILILDLNEHLLYSNPEALPFFKDPNRIPAEVRRLCSRMRTKVKQDDLESLATCDLFSGRGEVLYSLRAFLLRRQNGDSPIHVLILIEKVVERHHINLNRARAKFGLSNREIQIAADVAQGLSNKEVGSRLFISEYTVKDHLKNIMRKMRVASRGELVASLK